MDVVLVHGFFNRGGIMKRLARVLEQGGHRCHVPSLKPCDGRGGLALLARKLADYIAGQVPGGVDVPLVVVGFSMGALIARYYVQELEGWRRTRFLFSICGPHAGTRHARYYFTQGAREMRPGSEFLRALDAGADRLKGIGVVSYWTPHDLMIRPVASSQWAAGDVVCIPAFLHSLMPFDSRLHRDIAGRLKTLKSIPADRFDH